MVYDIFTYIIDTLFCRKERLYTCASNKFLFVFLANLVGQCIKLFLKLSLVKMHFHRNSLEIQLQGGTIIDRVLECVLRYIAIFVFFAAEASKGVMIVAVDRCTCQTEEKCIRQCCSHFLSEVAFLCAVGLVHEQDYIVAVINDLAIVQITELEDGSYEYLALVNLRFQFFLRRNSIHVWNLSTGKVTGNLIFQINTVIYNYHSRSLQVILTA